jgi:hypothetical protein
MHGFYLLKFTGELIINLANRYKTILSIWENYLLLVVFSMALL